MLLEIIENRFGDDSDEEMDARSQSSEKEEPKNRYVFFFDTTTRSLKYVIEFYLNNYFIV